MDRTLNTKDRTALIFAMNLSLGIGVLMLVIKLGAYLTTGSVAILSDLAESIIHLPAIAFSTYSLRLSYKPADTNHLYGHAKICFFSAGLEGGIIILTSLYVSVFSVLKWLQGNVLHNLDLGIWFTVLSAFINAGLGSYLIRIGKTKKSIILEADGWHILTDCWTSVGVLGGLGLTMFTQWSSWDPICAVIIALSMLVSGIGLVRKGVGGLMDTADPDVHQKLISILNTEVKKHDIIYHMLRHRNMGDTLLVEFHLLFPGGLPIRCAHRIATSIEETIEREFSSRTHVTTHLEALEDHGNIHSFEPH